MAQLWRFIARELIIIFKLEFMFSVHTFVTVWELGVELDGGVGQVSFLFQGV